MVTAAIVGAGNIARSHADAYQAHPDAELVAVMDTVPSRAGTFAAEFGIQAAPDLAALRAAGVELVSLCTPSPSHAGLAIEALSLGFHVLCEKPVALLVGDAAQMVAAAERASGLLMIGHVSRFEPDHAAARSVVQRGTIGDVRMMSQSIVASFPRWSHDGWLADESRSGGPLVDLAIHSFDYLNWITQARPIRVHAVGARNRSGIVDYALTTVRYDTGAIGMVETSWAHPEDHGLEVRTELSGTAGRLDWDYHGIELGSIATAAGLTPLNPLGNRGFRLEIAAFIEAIQRGRPSPVPASEALVALQVSLAAAESIRTSRPIELNARGDSR